MESRKHKWVIHEGFTDMEEMKLTMLRTVLHYGARVLWVGVFLGLIPAVFCVRH